MGPASVIEGLGFRVQLLYLLCLQGSLQGMRELGGTLCRSTCKDRYPHFLLSLFLQNQYDVRP